MVALKRDDLLKLKVHPVNDSRVVCSEHFEDHHYMCPARRYYDSSLVPTAVPSVFSFQSKPCLKRQPPTKRSAVPAKTRKLKGHLPQCD